MAATGLALTAGSLAGPASAQEKAPAAKPVIDKAASTESAQETRAFWTPERLRKALDSAEDMPHGPSATELKKKALEAARDMGMTASADSAPPAAEGKAAHGTKLAAGSVSERVKQVDSWPTVAVGRVVAKLPNGKLSACSGASISSKTKNTVWTAGHCVHPGDGSGVRGFYKKIAFVPAAQDKEQPYGTWAYDTVYAPQDWTRGDEGDYDAGDMAAFVVAPDPVQGNLADAVGHFGYNFGSGPDHSDAYDWGYPAHGYDRPDSDFNEGKYMMYCTGDTEDAENNWPWDDRVKMDCDMGKGASGGPLVTGAPDGNIQIIGANSHYEADDDDNRVSDDLFSSEHGDNAVQLIEDVDEDA
ncbi:serine protease [Streptomyces sp. Rer75]|uniref:trypsin-like serine peptidase n=1 Tax=unclassified Streptomyces TaxID=2593676 RepID=UPI0015CFA4D2|nr:trypsin-like peptidase domain-containing protein [Streptomyces sp. Rer75]QLH26600.1 trypsin-like peptidase domain-containing protein [Streptomyces sp. Rer75]